MLLDPEDKSASTLSMLYVPELQRKCLRLSKDVGITVKQLSDQQIYEHLLQTWIILHSPDGMGPLFNPANINHEVTRPLLYNDLIRLTIPAAFTAWLTTDTFRWHHLYPTINDVVDDKTYADAPGADFSYGLVLDYSLHSILRQGLRFLLDPNFHVDKKVEYYRLTQCQNWALEHTQFVKAGIRTETLYTPRL